MEKVFLALIFLTFSINAQIHTDFLEDEIFNLDDEFFIKYDLELMKARSKIYDDYMSPNKIENTRRDALLSGISPEKYALKMAREKQRYAYKFAPDMNKMLRSHYLNYYNKKAILITFNNLDPFKYELADFSNVIEIDRKSGSLLFGNQLRIFGKRNPEALVEVFFRLLKRWTKNEFDNQFLNIHLAEKNGVNIRYAPLSGNIIALASNMYDNCKAEIVIDVIKWEKLSTQQRALLIFHELLHDLFNIEHGAGSDIMYPIINPEQIDDEWLIFKQVYKTLEIAINSGHLKNVNCTNEIPYTDNARLNEINKYNRNRSFAEQKVFEFVKKNKYLNRGYKKSMLKDWEGTLEESNMHIKNNPNDGEGWILRGMAKTELNDKRGACSDWNKALEMGNKNALEYISRFCNEKIKTNNKDTQSKGNDCNGDGFITMKEFTEGCN